MHIPTHLLNSVERGKCVLVFGAGASVGSVLPNGTHAPNSSDLAGLLATEFLGAEHANDPLQIVAELAISESDQSTVQEFIRTTLQDLEPAPFHRLIPTFKWAGLATTNYDQVIERAYGSVEEPCQDLIPLIKNGDRIEDKLRTLRSLMLVKLHGCISRTNDPEIPLILSSDQYLTPP